MDYLLHVVVMISIFAILAISLNLLVGFAGLIALTQAVFFASGAYVTALLNLRFGLPFPLTVFASMLLTAGVGTLVTLPALRVAGEYLIIVTLALQVIVGSVLLNLSGLTGGADGLRGIAPVSGFGWHLVRAAQFAPLAVVAALLTFGVAARLAHSPFGRALEAMRENEVAAAAVGKNVVFLKTATFAFSAGLAAVAGSLYAHYFTFVSPSTFSISLTIYVLAMVALGGRGNLIGSVVGAALLVLLPEILKALDLPTDIADRGRDALYGLLLIAVLRVRPQGLFSRQRSAGPGLAKGGTAAWSLAPTGRPPEITLHATGLRRTFGGIVAVSDLDIALLSHQVTGLIGPNGAGKTTAFNLLTGFLAPDAGSLSLRGESLSGLAPHRILRRGIARSFQDLRLFSGLTVLENVLVALPNQMGDGVAAIFLKPGRVAVEERENAQRAQAILEFVGLGDKSDVGVLDLAYAEEKLLVIARLIATGAEVLLFDEPLSGLDPTTLDKLVLVIRRLAASGKTVCIIEHNLDVIRSLCDHVLFLDEGRVVAAGTPAALMSDPVLAARYFG